MIMTAKAFWFGGDPNRGGTSEGKLRLLRTSSSTSVPFLLK
jgi:hypothetical protein